MYPIHAVLFCIFLHLYFVSGTVLPHVDSQNGRGEAGGPVYDSPCPDGLPGRVTQIQWQSLSRPRQPAIYITDCSPSRNDTLLPSNRFESSSLDKRQEQICPADCSNQCSGGSGGGPSTSDCANLASQLNNRNSQFTVSGSQTLSMTYGTCMFQLANMNSSPFIYCDADWARRSTGVVGSCFPQSSSGMCQGSRFQAVVAVNNLAPPPPPPPAPAPTTNSDQGGGGDTTPTAGGGNTGVATGGNGATVSSGGNGGGTSNSGPGNTAGSNASSSSGAPMNTLSGSRGSATTLSNGSVLVLPTGDFGAESSGIGSQQPTTSSSNIPAIVGGVLGLLFLLLLTLLLLLWRRKRRAQRKLVGLEQSNESPPRDSSVARTIDVDARLHAAPVLGSERDGGVVETPMTETPIGGASAWATRSKARMYAEQERSEQTDFSSIEPSAYTSPEEPSPAPAYRGRSLGSRRDGERRGCGHRSGGGSREHPLFPRRTGSNGDAYASDSYSTLTGSCNSMSARTFAQAVAPALSPSDIERLAESIVARMQGRDPALRERLVEGEEGQSVMGEDEPPPPWSAAVANAHV